MNKSFVLSLGIVWTVSLLAGQGIAQEVGVKPGPEHAFLKSLEGNWSCVMKAGEQQSKGTSTTKAVLGGLWMVTEFKGELGGGIPFEGRGIDGYDTDKKKFVSVWVDNMTTSILNFEGTYDESTKTLTSYADGKSPDGKPVKHKSVTTIPDKDHQVFKMLMVGADNSETLLITVEYTRQKK